MKFFDQPGISRRAFTGAALAAMATLPAKGGTTHSAKQSPVSYSDRPKPRRETKNLRIGCLVFPRQDQIDFTGPFEVFSRIPNAQIYIVGKTGEPVSDVKGLVLTPDTTLEKARALQFDVLLVPGGYGQQELMCDEEYLSLIREQSESGRVVFSVCTGALLCGAAGILRGRQATTHWAAWDLLHYYGASPIRSRVVVDGNYVSCAGVTAGIDGALLVSSLLCGDAIAEEIQLEIEYAPNSIFTSGSPDTARTEVVQAFFSRYSGVKQSREQEARKFQQISEQRDPA